MVFHVPFPIEWDANTASAIRPAQMLKAFVGAGYDVFPITGYAKQRRGRLAALRQKLAAGWRPDFAYSEVATIPASFTEPRHFPLVPLLDRSVFRTLFEGGIPLGVFYRDVYWAFPEYRKRVGVAVAAAMTGLYRWELDAINRYAKTVFLPSLAMAPQVPGLAAQNLAGPASGGPQVVALPAGCKPARFPVRVRAAHSPLHLLYVGGLGGEHYDLRVLVEAVTHVPSVQLTICTRRDQWRQAKGTYEPLLGDNVRVVHEQGGGLDALYREADVGVLMMAPQQYRSFAMPMKLFEYMGQGLPVLASADTQAGAYVQREGAGWAPAYERAAITRVLRALAAEREQVRQMGDAALRVAKENTWTDRALEVARTLNPSGRLQPAAARGGPSYGR